MSFLNVHAVFGWFENSFIGLEQEIAHSLSAGYLKGAEQAGEGATMILNVMRIFRNASKLANMYRSYVICKHVCMIIVLYARKYGL